MILAEVTFIPIGVGTSASKYVKIALDTFRREGIRYFPNSMGTVLEDESMEKILSTISSAESAIIKSGVKRVETQIKIDHRIDLDNTVERKLKAVHQD